MDSNAQLECLAHIRRFHALADAAPEGRIKQDHIDCRVEHVCRELLEAHHHSVSRKWHSHFLARSPHAVQSKDRILEVIVFNILNGLPEPDGLLSRPDRVWVETETVAIERRCDGTVTLKLIFRSKHATL